MTLRRISFATTILCGLCVWALARSGDTPAANTDPILAENATGSGNHDEAAAHYRTNQANHWKHIVVGNYASNR